MKWTIKWGVTRPDISYYVHILSQFVSAPTQIHYSHLLHVLCYLFGIISHRLFFPCSSSLQLQAYCDATWACDLFGRYSLSAYCVFLGGSLIALKTKKQVAVSHSRAEAKLRAMAPVTAEVTCLQWLLKDFDVSVPMLTPLLSNSTGAISIAHNPEKHELTKHIGIDAHFTRSQIQECCRSSVCAFRASAGRFLYEGLDSCSSSILPLQTQCC
jgi:hypothetical protein